MIRFVLISKAAAAAVAEVAVVAIVSLVNTVCGGMRGTGYDRSSASSLLVGCLTSSNMRVYLRD